MTQAAAALQETVWDIDTEPAEFQDSDLDFHDISLIQDKLKMKPTERFRAAESFATVSQPNLRLTGQTFGATQVVSQTAASPGFLHSLQSSEQPRNKFSHAKYQSSLDSPQGVR